MKSLDEASASSPTSEELLQASLTLLSTLPSPSSSPLRRKFPSITTSTTRLLSSLPSLPLTTPLALPLLASLVDTLTRLHSLGSCPPTGKLQLQSELSACASALELLASDADLLVCSEDGSSDGDLISRLQVGPISSRLAALDSLLSDQSATSASSLQSAVPSLLKLLEPSASLEAREKATSAFAKLCSLSATSSHDIITSNEVGPILLTHLSRLLDSGTTGTGPSILTENVCTVLQTLTLIRENAVALASRGGVGPLLEICQAGTPSAQASAAGVLKNLARIETLKNYFVEENAIVILINICELGTPNAKNNIIGCLCNLAGPTEEESQDLKIRLFKDGVLECVKGFLDLEIQDDEGNWDLESGICLVRQLASFRYIAEIITNNGFIPYITSALDDVKSSVRIEAALALAELASTGKVIKEICESIPKLVKMLENKIPKEREAGAKALAHLMPVSGYRRIFRKDEGGIVNVVQLLDPLTRDVERKYPVSILLSLSQSRKCRKQMVAAGACGYLRGSLVIEVEGAKKLLECLGRGRILGVFPRV
ncbi:hypothetical protein LUZ60_007908 [Juncus effusus]|nr:hypothetical protein LUZ60_007908 [Juncus effusus]